MANELENNIISVFSRDGRLQFGLHELCDIDRDANDLCEIEAGYIFDEHVVFTGYDSDCVWIVDAAKRTCRKSPASFSLIGIRFLTRDDKRAYAIYDHRRLLQHYPNRPPFELAVFDLASETAAKQDFAPVETALTAAGFAMSEIKFQPNSTGRIIVSDTKQAAPLELAEPSTG